MQENIGIIGGNLRIVKLAELLKKDNYNIYTYGLEESELDYSIIRCQTIKDVAENCNNIISSIPLTKDLECINSPFCKTKISIKQLFGEVKGKKLFTGAIKKETKKMAENNNIEIIDLLSEEQLTILNAIPTAEGAIQIAMQETQITLHDSNCLILGFGRIGKILAKMLKGIGANVYCEARKQEDLAWISAYGYNKINLEKLDENLNNYDIIFNTIPNVILDEKKLRELKENCLVIDLASSPGGVDFERAKQIGVKTIWALALPGKVAPLTSAKYIQEVLYKKIRLEK